MRIALLSDIHGNLPALEAVVADVRRRGADRIVCLGDNLSGPLMPLQTASYLMDTGWLVLAGNHERQILEVEARLAGVRAPLVACGHSHVPRAVRLPSGALIVNPGSVGLQAYTDDHPRPHAVENGTPDARYAMVERQAGTWCCSHHAVPYDTREVARLARLRARPEWERALLSGYVR